jgi:hypothetical protein
LSDIIINNHTEFDWDEDKNVANIKKHKISFREAVTIFQDENYILSYDESSSQGEDRFNALGTSVNSRLLVVCHCYRESDTVIRVISARKATAKERLQYER